MAMEYNHLFIKTEIKTEPEEYVEPDYELSEPDFDTPLNTVVTWQVKQEQQEPSASESKPRPKKRDKEKPTLQTYICTICNIMFEGKLKYSSHMKIHKEPTHQCDKCDRKFKSAKNMGRHTCAICNVCGLKASSRSHLRTHMKQQHADAADKIYSVQCDYCAKWFKTKTYLVHHMRAAHVVNEKTQLLCSICGAKFPHKFLLDKHLLIKHTEMIACRLCGKFVKPLCMPYHMKQVHASERNFLCTICSASFKTKCNFTDHLKTHNKTYVCKVCDKRFARPDHLREHMQLHNDPNAFSCMICGHKYSSASYLKRHMKAHGEQNVKCRICGVDVSALSLHYHMKNVHRFDRFVCEKCGSTGFESQKDYKEHLRGHEKERVEVEKMEKRLEAELREAKAKEEQRALEIAKESAIVNIQPPLKPQIATTSAKSGQLASKVLSKGKKKKVETIVRKEEERKPLDFVTSTVEDSFDGYSNFPSGFDDNQLSDIDDSYASSHGPQSSGHRYSPDHAQLQPKIEIKEEPLVSESAPNPFDTFICDIVRPLKRLRRWKAPSVHPRWLKIPKNSIVTCDFCGDEYEKKSKLMVHIRQLHVPDDNSDLHCKICMKFYPHPSSFEKHMMSHDNTLVQCEICGKKVKPQCLSNHIRQVHTIYRTLECPTCGKAYKTKQNLREHMKYHSKSFQCEMCGRNFARKTDLNEHMLSHKAPELLECPFCHVRLSDRKTLKKHIAYKHGDGVSQPVKAFKCELCDYACSQKGNLKIHYRKHEKYEQRKQRMPNALTCGICSALFTTELLLKLHHKKVHSDKRYPCEYCDVVLKTKSGQWTHIRNVHHVEPERKKKKPKPPKVRKDKKPRKKRRRRNSRGELVEREDAPQESVDDTHEAAAIEVYSGGFY